MTGRFVTVEGIEGSGKSTLLRSLAERLRRDGHDLLETYEPGDSELGREIRRLLLAPSSRGMDPLTELLLYCADRAEHVARVIRPALAAGRHVLCDRYGDATRAYQGAARGLDRALIERVDVSDLKPDLTLIVDLPVAIGLTRARGRNIRDDLGHEARFEHETLDFHDRVRQGYLAIARAEPDRCRVLNGESAPDALVERAYAIIAPLLGDPGAHDQAT